MESTHLLERSAVEGTYAPESVKWAQLEPGLFEVRYGTLDAGPLRLTVRSMNVGFTAEADLATNKCMLGLTADTRTRVRWFGTEIDERDIFASGSVLMLSTRGPSSFYAVSVDGRELQRQFPTAPDALDLMENVQSPKLARDPIHAKRLRTSMHRVFSSADFDQATRPQALPPNNIYGALIPLLANAVEALDVHLIEPSKCRTRRLAAVRTCEDYMREHVDTTITLLDLGRVAGMRSRSLINAFEAVTGSSPMDYLKRLRLNGVHRALQRADKGRTRIIDLATDWGFWHMGHFTTDYRAMFGETPSRTLVGS